MVFWSNRLSVVLKARKYNYKAELLKGRFSEESTLSDDLESAFEVQYGFLTLVQAKRCRQRAETAARILFRKHNPDFIFFWNGCNLIRQTLIAICSDLGASPLYFEVGNFPGKLFVDCEGVNSRSWYARHRDELRTWDIDRDSFEKWKKTFLKAKLQKHEVPQTHMSLNFNKQFFYDLIGFWFMGAIPSDPPCPFWRTFDFIKRKCHRIPLDNFVPEHNRDYLLFPLQVSTDSQVLWNSDISQVEALRRAAESAKKEGKLLVVKPHPAEPHWAALREILHLKAELGFKLVGGNTFQLLEHCDRVITLNSTVGLEALLLGKPVETLGRAHYDGFDELDLAIYIQKYLLNIDFFSNQPISESQLDAILSRGNINT